MKYDALKLSRFLIKKYGITILLSFVTIFFIGSLLTFSTKDPSWFYHTSNIQSYKNMFGLVGSHAAAWLIYLFGQAAFLFPIIFFYCVVLYFCMHVIKKITFATEWDRTAGMIVGFLNTTMLFQLYNSAEYSFSYPGGIVGNYLIKNILSNFDLLTQKIIIVTSLFISAILILRCSYIPLLKKIAEFMQYIFNSKNLPARMVKKTYQLCFSILKNTHYLIARSIQLITGSVLKKIDCSIVEFEYEKKVDQDIEEVMHDLFWNDYLGISKKDDIIPTKKLELFEDEVQQTIIPKKVEPVAQSVAPKIEKNIATQPKKVTYNLPALPIKKIDKHQITEKHDHLQAQAKLLEEKLEQFYIKGTVIAMHAGPVVTLFEYQPDIKVKVSRILSLEDDLAMALKALSIRIIAPIPGRSVVGFEVANSHRLDVLFSNILDSATWKNHTGFLPMIFGQDTLGNNIIADLAKMPHLLIAGSTGSGKSVALNAMLVSLLCSLRPDELKLIIIDPKRLEFAAYDGIAHLLFPIVTETKKAIPILKWVVQTMESRYEIMAKHGVRNLLDYQAAAKNNKEMEPMPLIVVIIDELADLMITAGKAVEDSIARIAQMARAAGIHMIIATQRPSVDVITGMIKVNFPNRVAFKVTSKIDSRTILDSGGAEKLLGRGDMLFLDATKSHLVRVHGAYVSDAEIHAVVAQIKAQQKVQYLDIFEQFEHDQNDDIFDGDDELYKEIVEHIKTLDEVSISMLQRHFRIGYNRSARIVSTLESKGLIISVEGGKTRRVVK